MTGHDHTVAKRQEAYRQRQKKQGRVRVSLYVPASQVETIREIAKRLTQDAAAQPQPESS